MVFCCLFHQAEYRGTDLFYFTSHHSSICSLLSWLLLSLYIQGNRFPFFLIDFSGFMETCLQVCQPSPNDFFKFRDAFLSKYGSHTKNPADSFQSHLHLMTMVFYWHLSCTSAILLLKHLTCALVIFWRVNFLSEVKNPNKSKYIMSSTNMMNSNKNIKFVSWAVLQNCIDWY